MSSTANKLRRHIGHDHALEKETTDQIDFKMVTFSLAGKDYGIDIMKVREIARIVNFTYVPNTPAFVRGVYNLRGEIISIIDLRAMFNLPFQQKATTEEESGLILRLDNTLIGIIVDKIDKVVGINSASIQPPHPIFGDINIKFISGVVENDGRLYIILDADKVLGKPNIEKKEAVDASFRITPDVFGSINQSTLITGSQDGENNQNKVFIKESLQALAGFTVSDINETWFANRYAQWEKDRNGSQVQVKSQEDARLFLEDFYSPMSGQLWDEMYFRKFIDALPEKSGAHFNVWNPGCARGYETYSMAVALHTKYPDSRIKIWASDKDLLNISSAPNLVFSEKDIPELYAPFMTSGKNGFSFSQKIKEMILFEYHDISHDHNLPPLDLVLSRDVFSFLPANHIASLKRSLWEKLKSGGIVILGRNEVLPAGDGWTVKDYQLMQVAKHD